MGKIQLLGLGLALLAPAGAAEIGFWEELTPAERHAAGLDHLTPEQRAALDRLAERLLHPGAPPAGAITEQARKEIREQAKAEVRAQVRTEVKRELQAEEQSQAAARAGLPGESGPTVIRTRIAGSFNGWSGATAFRLQNGQVWVQIDSSDRYWLPAVENPEVELRASKLGGWKLYLVNGGAWLRVRRLQ
jgi:hypothetical protein